MPARPLRDWRLVADRGLLAREAVAWSSARTTGGTGDAGATTLTEFVGARAVAPLDPTREPLFDLAVRELRDEDGATRTLLALRWWHPACDERGADLLLREVSQRYCGETPRPAATTLQNDGAITGFSARHAAFRRARRRLDELTAARPHALPPPSQAERAAPYAWTFRRTLLDEDETARWLARAEARFGARSEGLAQLALVARALAADAPDSAEIALPLTVQLRPPRARGPVAANEISFLWYAFTAAATRDEAGFAQALLATARAKVVDGEEQDAIVLLDRARRMPLSIYRRELARRDGSPRFSAILSTVGEMVGGARELFGAPLDDVLALTAFPAPPGVAFLFSRAAGRLSFTTGAASREVSHSATVKIHERIAAALRALHADQ